MLYVICLHYLFQRSNSLRQVIVSFSGLRDVKLDRLLMAVPIFATVIPGCSLLFCLLYLANPLITWPLIQLYQLYNKAA